ncbi:MAG: SpoIIE family protein phosphatase [Bacteroidales bacterium]|nr:SpoIIE family protein phosphatase [Bacteroidales bacterium]
MVSKKIGFTKLIIGFVVILSITFFSAIYSSLTIRSNSKTILHINNDIYPFMDKLAKFEQITLNSKMLITNWVYLQYNTDDKKALKKLIAEDYPKIKKEILSSLNTAGHEDNRAELINIFNLMDSLLLIEKDIMQTLVTFEDYQNPIKVFEGEEIIENQVIPLSKQIKDLTEKFILHTQKENDIIRGKMLHSLSKLEKTAFIFGFGMFIIILFSVIYIQRNITVPILKVHNILIKLSRGEIVKQKVDKAEDVIAHMADALNKLSGNLNQIAISASKIGQGKFDTKIQPLSENDVLGNAILEMKNSLKEYSEEMESKVKERTIEIRKQKDIIEAKNKDITASISYAERIQTASLPSIEIIEKELNEYFILFKPKDIVSGDFYWFTKIDDLFIIAAIDCTGHGVPGAFMSLVGLNLLAAIVMENKITQPQMILEELHKRVQSALRQSDTANQDGMDAAICVIDKEKNIVEFSGARNPLIYIQDKQLFKVKGDRKSVGGNQSAAKYFTKHTINIKSPTSFYLFSDGYQDQFGGPNNRKFMVKNMYKMFMENNHLPMKEQKEIYNNTIESWMSITDQIDDILLMGFKL